MNSCSSDFSKLYYLLQGRFSVVGSQPAIEVLAKENKVTILDHSSGKIVEKMVEDPMTVPRSISESWRPQLTEDLPDAFCGEDLVSFNISGVHIC